MGDSLCQPWHLLDVKILVEDKEVGGLYTFYQIKLILIYARINRVVINAQKIPRDKKLISNIVL